MLRARLGWAKNESAPGISLRTLLREECGVPSDTLNPPTDEVNFVEWKWCEAGKAGLGIRLPKFLGGDSTKADRVPFDVLFNGMVPPSGKTGWNYELTDWLPYLIDLIVWNGGFDDFDKKLNYKLEVIAEDSKERHHQQEQAGDYNQDQLKRQNGRERAPKPKKVSLDTSTSTGVHTRTRSAAKAGGAEHAQTDGNRVYDDQG